MQALMYTENYELKVSVVGVPEPASDEVLVRVAAAGICGSDIHGVASRSPRRQPPLIMGHELVGEVVAAGGAAGEPLIGAFVVVNPQVPCGRCTDCRSGRENICAARELVGGTRPGGFAEYVSVPARCAHRVHYADATVAVFAEPLATCVHAVGLVSTRFVDTAVVIGAGTIGLLVAQVLQLSGVGTLVLCDPDERRRDGASAITEHVTAPDELAAVVSALTTGRGADVVIDAVGVETARRQSLELLTVGGMAVWLGMDSAGADIPAFDVVVKEQRIQGAFAYTNPEFATAVRLLDSAALEPSVSHLSVPIGASAEVFIELLKTGPQSFLKAIIGPGGTPNGGQADAVATEPLATQ